MGMLVGIYVLVMLNFSQIKYGINMIGLYKSDEEIILHNPLENIESKNDIDEKIVEDYASRLESLQAKFEDRLDSLLSEALSDYSEDGNFSIKFISKYSSLGADLEKSSDGEFKSLIKHMEEELEEKNQDKAIIKDLEKYYKDFKDSKKTNILSQGMAIIEK